MTDSVTRKVLDLWLLHQANLITKQARESLAMSRHKKPLAPCFFSNEMVPREEVAKKIGALLLHIFCLTVIFPQITSLG